MTTAELRAAIARYRMHALGIGLALFVLVVSLALGITAQRQLAAARITDMRLHQSLAEIANFRSAFRPSTPEQDAHLLLPDSLAFAVPHDLRMSVAGQLATRAERVGLSDVRVRFAGTDSAAAPQHPDFVDHPVKVGDYTIALECNGSLAQVLSLVQQVPTAAALQRMTAARDPKSPGVHYSLVFDVYETEASGGGNGGQHG